LKKKQEKIESTDHGGMLKDIRIIFCIIFLVEFAFLLRERSSNDLEQLKADNVSKICFITAIFGSYEASCKRFAEQSVPTDFICFTDNANITSNGWTIDTLPYHILSRSKLDKSTYTNSMKKNQHTFNIAKYYKQAFINIPRLHQYDTIIWLDGSIEITYNKTSEYILSKIQDKKIIGWHHERRFGSLDSEVTASNISRYTSQRWNGQLQPLQDVRKQYEYYIKKGYRESYFEEKESHTPHFGVWVTCFVAFLQHDKEVQQFLDLWYLQTLKFTTQDQVGFSYAAQSLNMLPYTLPNDEIHGNEPHQKTMFYVKHDHGS